MQLEDRDSAGLSAQERRVLDWVAARERATVTVDDVMTLRNVSRSTANQILARLYRKGWLRRPTRGVYVPVPLGLAGVESAGSDAWLLAMKLFAPCFISGWSAAEHWDLTEQTFNATAVVSGRQQRRSKQAVGGATFRVRTLPERRIFGATRIWIGSNAVQMADQHRLLVDILDDPSFGGGGRHTLDVVRSYWSGGSANPDKLLDHAIRFGRGTVFKRMGFTAELYGEPSPGWLAECSSHMTAGVSRFDPAGPAKGRIVSKWRLRVNVPMVTE